MAEITLGIIVDHHNCQIIYGDTKYVEYLEKFLRLDARVFTEEVKYLKYFEEIITQYPEYAIVRACIDKNLHHKI